LNTGSVTQAYYGALQAIPGFEVLPVGVTKLQYQQYVSQLGEPTEGKDFQALARAMGVEALVVGSVTDFDTYYPPRMAMTVHWYAANEGYHPIPEGYGLPWGTDQEKHIPSRVAKAAEFELARSQLATQEPITIADAVSTPAANDPGSVPQNLATPIPPPTQASHTQQVDSLTPLPDSAGDIAALQPAPDHSLPAESYSIDDGLLPHDWPAPTDLIPDPPSPVRPVAVPNHRPVISHTQLYSGDDPYFTNRLADFVETGDDARPAGWQGYLKRSDDFIRFCCHLHIVEMLESRGGSDQRDLILRWPLSRY